MSKEERRGKSTTCQKCKYKFKFKIVKDRINFYKNKSPCPLCGELYCNKPPTERILFSLQDDYYHNNKDVRIFEKMITILISYSKSLIKKTYSSYINSTEDLNYYAHNAVAFFVEYYLKDAEFNMHSSFGGMLNKKIRQALFSKNERSIPGESLNWELEDGHEVTYLDDKYNFILSLENKENTMNVYNYVMKLILNIELYCEPFEDYKRLLAFRHYIISGEKEADRLFQEEIQDDEDNIIQYKTYGRYAKEKYLNTLDFLKKELMDISKFKK